MVFRYVRVTDLPETLLPNELLFHKTGAGVQVLASDKLATARLPLSETVALQGPVVVVDGEIAEYLITAYSDAKTYDVSSSNGNISRNGDTITFTPSISAPGEASFKVNDQLFTIFVNALQILQPEIQAPVDNSEDIGPANVTITASTFELNSTSAYDTHESTDWEVATDPQFTNIVYSSYDDSTNKTSITIA